ncbi:hypothetical protein [Brevibacillus invocatus]|uniref:hypothetical protein n=1 Tax=Brevibacillus invocatus TaxID=173959 RepID=UPI00203A7A0C|nr:hypothetical protein [Brevibacillus invocatus]MCM3430010.1 hypothetical protein [Brevibacillus invocatus]
MNPFKESVHFYTRHIESLLILSAVIVLPLLLLHNMTINYVHFLAVLTGAPVVASFYNLFLLLLFLTLVQIAFAQFVISEREGEERPLRKAFRMFFENGFSVFLFGIVYVLAVCIGLLLFVVPGVIVLILFYLTPYLTVMKQKSPWQCFRSALEMGKRHFVQILGLMILTSAIQWLISLIGMASVTFVTTSFGAIFFTQILLTVLIFPFIAVLFTMYTYKWSAESVRATETEGLAVEG